MKKRELVSSPLSVIYLLKYQYPRIGFFPPLLAIILSATLFILRVLASISCFSWRVIFPKVYLLRLSGKLLLQQPSFLDQDLHVSYSLYLPLNEWLLFIKFNQCIYNALICKSSYFLSNSDNNIVKTAINLLKSSLLISI